MRCTAAHHNASEIRRARRRQTTQPSQMGVAPVLFSASPSKKSTQEADASQNAPSIDHQIQSGPIDPIATTRQTARYWYAPLRSFPICPVQPDVQGPKVVSAGRRAAFGIPGRKSLSWPSRRSRSLSDHSHRPPIQNAPQSTGFGVFILRPLRRFSVFFCF